MRQMSLIADPSIRAVESLNELYDAAAAARPIFERVLLGNVLSHVPNLASDRVHVIGLKGRERAAQKAVDDYSQRSSGPGEAWLFDIVRGSIECDNEEQIVAAVRAVESQPEFQIVRLKNRFKNPTPAGFRDININIRVFVPITASDDAQILVPHTCELQIHHISVKAFAKENHSHSHYEYFRVYFSGSADALNDRLALFHSIGDFDSTTGRQSETAGVQSGFALESVVDNAIDKKDTVKLQNLHRLLFEVNEYELAERVARCLVEISVNQPPPYSISQIHSINALVSSLQHQMRSHEALDWCKQMLMMLPAVNNISLQEKRYEIGLAELHLGLVLHDAGQLQDALQHAQVGLTAIALVRGRRGMQYAYAITGVGIILVALGRLPEALPLLNEASDIRRAEVGDQHELTIQSLYYLANWSYLAQQYEQARVLAEQTLNLRRKVLGEDHKDTVIVMSLMAMILSQLGQPTEALALQEKTVAVLTATVGEEHADTTSAMNNLGQLYLVAGQPQKALEQLTKGLRIALRVLGSEHFLAATYANNIGAIYVREAQFAEALPYFQQSLDIRLQSLGPAHMHTGKAYSDLGTCQLQLGLVEAGASSLEKGLNINRNFATSPDLATTLNSLGPLYQKLGRPVDALAVLKEAYVRFARALGQQDITTASVLNNLGNVYRDLGAVNQAIFCLNQARTLFIRLLGQNHLNTINVNGNLGIAMLFQTDPGMIAQGQGILTATVGFLRNAGLPADHPFLVKFVVALQPQFVSESKSQQAKYIGVVKDSDPVVPSSLNELGIVDSPASPLLTHLSVAAVGGTTSPLDNSNSGSINVAPGTIINNSQGVSPLHAWARNAAGNDMGQQQTVIVRVGGMNIQVTTRGGAAGADAGAIPASLILAGMARDVRSANPTLQQRRSCCTII